MAHGNEIGFPLTPRNEAPQRQVARLSDPAYPTSEDRDELEKLLLLRSLTPVSAPCALYGHGTVELQVYPTYGQLYIVGVLSLNASKEIEIIRVEASGQTMFRNVDAAVFNRSHLVPLSLGWVSNVNPILVTCCPVGTPSCLPLLDLTFWGLTREAFELEARDELLHDASFWRVVGDLRRDPPADPRVAALLDKLQRFAP